MRDALVQQPKTAATLSLTSSFLLFSAKVGQSEAPSSLMTLIFRPRMPPIALIWSMASCSAWIEPVSEMAIVPVAECNWPTVTSVSVIASLVVLIFAVGNCWASAQAGMPAIGSDAMPWINRRRWLDCGEDDSSRSFDMGTPAVDSKAGRIALRLSRMVLTNVRRPNTSINVSPRAATASASASPGRNASCPLFPAQPPTALTAATQKIFRIRRDYNAWVADESMEDYALRYTPRSFRKWSELRVANTAFGAVSFLALEAIGGAIALNYGFTNALWAILTVGLITFLTGLPISYYAARYGVDMDLLTRGAGFGYLGSTITSLIYASFTFIFFALEAAIMALALQMFFDIPIAWCYVISSLVIIPMVVRGITLISKLQMWTQPVWGVLLLAAVPGDLLEEPAGLQRFHGPDRPHLGQQRVRSRSCLVQRRRWRSPLWCRSANRSTSCASCRSRPAPIASDGGRPC